MHPPTLTLEPSLTSLWDPVPSVDTGFGYWLAGFIDGEGCFVIREQKGEYRPAFQLRLRDDDLPVLHYIRHRLGVGDIYGERGRPDRAGYVSRPKALFWIQSKATCMRLVEVLDRAPLRSKKARDYAIWREAVLEHYSPQPDQSRLAFLKLELECGRKYPEPLKGQALLADARSGEFDLYADPIESPVGQEGLPRHPRGPPPRPARGRRRRW